MTSFNSSCISTRSNSVHRAESSNVTRTSTSLSSRNSPGDRIDPKRLSSVIRHLRQNASIASRSRSSAIAVPTLIPAPSLQATRLTSFFVEELRQAGEDVDRQREDDGRVLLHADLRQRLQVAELQRGRLRGQNVRGIRQSLRRGE